MQVENDPGEELRQVLGKANACGPPHMLAAGQDQTRATVDAGGLQSRAVVGDNDAVCIGSCVLLM